MISYVISGKCGWVAGVCVTKNTLHNLLTPTPLACLSFLFSFSGVLCPDPAAMSGDLLGLRAEPPAVAETISHYQHRQVGYKSYHYN